jgi:hypothetical protein
MKSRWLVAALAGAACGAPQAVPISGDVNTVLERAIAEGDGTFDHREWDELLSKYALDGGRRFDYAGLKKEESRLRRYLDELASADLARLSRAELQALFMNAYNALTVATILDHVSNEGVYEIESIRDIENVFTREEHEVGGFRLSLDGIEHNILRPLFRDPRIHFGVNCASISCPPLPTRAFTGAGVDRELESAAERFFAQPEHVSVEEGSLVLNPILEWYGSDFTSPGYRGAEATVAAFVRKYAAEDVRSFIDGRTGEVPVRFREYDWRLNRAGRP